MWWCQCSFSKSTTVKQPVLLKVCGGVSVLSVRVTAVKQPVLLKVCGGVSVLSVRVTAVKQPVLLKVCGGVSVLSVRVTAVKQPVLLKVCGADPQEATCSRREPSDKTCSTLHRTLNLFNTCWGLQLTYLTRFGVTS